ncbi:MAG TPA: GlsB/YeaQ/YmgE family stress response membrane protein [Actinomycetota bacterium]|nr:GlsB/YeaQ/YmgE family stress response membrane protein [Actinomycetota bacterium]
MRSLLFWIVVGGVAGWLASIVTGTGKRMGCLLNILAGVVGAVIGGWVFQKLDLVAPSGHFVGSIVVAFVGAVIFLGVLRLFGKR